MKTPIEWAYGIGFLHDWGADLNRHYRTKKIAKAALISAALIGQVLVLALIAVLGILIGSAVGNFLT